MVTKDRESKEFTEMRVTTIRFNLKFFNADGGEDVVRTLDDLRDKFNLSDLDEYFKAGDLSRWLRGLGESTMADQVDSLKNVLDKRQALERLCNALGMPIQKEAIADYCNMLERQKKMKSSRREQVAAKERQLKQESRRVGEHPTRDMRDMETVRAYLVELMERHDEKEMQSFLHEVINECIIKDIDEHGGPPVVLLALMGNMAWRDFVTASFDVRLMFHIFGSDRQMKIAIFPKDMTDSQLQGLREFEFNEAFPRYFPICSFDYDIITNNYVYDIVLQGYNTDKQIVSREVEDLPYDELRWLCHNGNHIRGDGCEEPLRHWRQQYVSIRWGNAMPSWEERKAETEEMLKQWMQKHFYWN